MIVFHPGVTKINHRPKMKKKLFLNDSSSPQPFGSSTQMSSKKNIAYPKLKDVTISLNKLSSSFAEKFSHRAGAGKTGKDPEGVAKEKGFKVGWAARKGGWEGEMDDWGAGGGWEKGKTGWGRGRAKGGWKGGKVQKKKSSLMDGFDDDISPDFVPNKKRTIAKICNKVTQSTNVYTQPDQKLRGTDCSLQTPYLSTHIFSRLRVR